ncbi:MAG: DUF488 domain-containing protein [Chloroflexi bacterium]|nr:DUF488 domain-containing protein [Chloroflexota bacterium]
MHQIAVLVDVRSAPYSRYTPHFNRGRLREEVVAAGLKYGYLGEELGGRPECEEFYDSAGHVLYGRLASSPLFLEGIGRLERGADTHRIAVMCSEEDPSGCHRHLLIGRVLAERGIAMYHIRGDGRLQSEAELEEAAKHRRGEDLQPTLWEDAEVRVWKSIRSVSPKNQHRSSSER